MKVDVVYTAVQRPQACFKCRKSFKRPRIEFRTHRPLRRDERSAFEARATEIRQSGQYKHACPQCGGPTAFMGVDFKPPKMTDKKAWAEVEAFIRSGKFYSRGRGMPERALRIGGSFWHGRNLMHAIRRAGLTVDDIPEMYHHKIPDFIQKLNRLVTERE